MRWNDLRLGLAFACGLAASAIGSSLLAQQTQQASGVETPGIEQIYLLNQPLAEFPGKNVVVFIGDFEPGASTSLHQHPGTEFLFVLEGNGVMERPGREPAKLEPGVIVLSEPDPGESAFTHRAINSSETEGMKTLVLVIHDLGSPTMVPLEE